MNAAAVTAALGFVACAGIGTSVMLAIGRARARRMSAELDRAALVWHRRHQAKCDELIALEAAVTKMSAPLLESQWRHGFGIPLPVRRLIRPLPPEEVYRWLLEEAPGGDVLKDAADGSCRYATWNAAGRFFPAETFGGWTGPPRLAQATANGREEP